MQSRWTRDEDKIFEKALVDLPEGIVGRWQKIADLVPGKTAEQARIRYLELVHDLDQIEAGQVQLPNYESFMSWDSESRTTQISFKHGEAERKKGNPWTQEEHRKFLEGLEKYGKGDWRSISRNSVITRTPTQVASHAQKYFLRHTSTGKTRKRSSIHDITTADITKVVHPLPPLPPPRDFYRVRGGGQAPPPPPPPSSSPSLTP